MEKQIKITEKDIKEMIKEGVKRVLAEGYMSDEEIAQQYSDFKVDGSQIEGPTLVTDKYNGNKYWRGKLVLVFPNANEEDYDSTMVENWMSYDIDGDKIVFENWYPKDVHESLLKFIRATIMCKKKKQHL